MELLEVKTEILAPAFALLPDKMNSRPATIMLLAIGLQESQFLHRRQIGGGPARGLWQFERGGGVHGVLRHQASAKLAAQVCANRGVEPTDQAVWEALEQDDVLAAAMARLLLWTDPKPLPTYEAGGWDLYERVWRPGQPRPEKWSSNYQAARQAA